MEFIGLTSASHMSLPEAGYGSEEGQLGSEISGAVSGVTTPGASRLQASQSQQRSTTMQRLHSHKARSRVNNDRFEDLVSAADLASMCSLKVIMDRCEVVEERDVEVVLIGVRLHRRKPVIDGVRVEQVARRRVGFLAFLAFISIDIPSELDRSTPTLSNFVSGLEGGHEVFQGTQASNQFGGIHERKKVGILFIR